MKQQTTLIFYTTIYNTKSIESVELVVDFVSNLPFVVRVRKRSKVQKE
jgi:hypothetical protein